MLTDRWGQEIKVGSVVCAPQRQGSMLWLQDYLITEISEGERYWYSKKQPLLKALALVDESWIAETRKLKKVTLWALERLTVLPHITEQEFRNKVI